jgi:phage N-6-adenine-methyltransferase
MLIGHRSSNHPQQVDRRGPDLDVDDRTTHPSLFDPLHARFGFTVDVAASDRNHRVAPYFTRDTDGLAQSWGGHTVWCNPPYSNLGPWVAKAWREWFESQPTVVMLLPANRTEQAWWQDLVEPYRDRDDSPLRTEFLRGRQRFIRADRDDVGPNERPPFGCVLLIWGGPIDDDPERWGTPTAHQVAAPLTLDFGGAS